MSGESRKDTVGQCVDRSLTPSSLTARDIPLRPPINYSSFGAFWKSVGKRWKSIWTKHFVLALLAGQLLSLCITCTNVTTTELVSRGWTLSTTQGFFLWVLIISNLIQAENPLSLRYFTLFLIYTPYTIYQCRLLFCDVPAIDILSLRQMDSRDGERLFYMMDGDVRRFSQNYWQSCNETSDIILGACDVEGNFLVVKVRSFIGNR